MISIAFAGTPDFAVPSLQAFLDDPEFTVELVITQPDRPVGRKQIMTPPPVKVLAQQHQLNLWQPTNINREFSPQFTPDFLVVVAYGQILKDPLLKWPRLAPINLHASLLPRWRGASPIQQAILAGDKTSGVTVQKIVKELDAGDVLAKQSTPLSERETSSSLHNKLAQLGAELLVATLKKPLQPTPQDPQHITKCRKLSRADGKLDPTKLTAPEIDRQVRALVPWPGVTMSIAGHTVKIIATSLNESKTSLTVKCRDGSLLYVNELQPPGKPVMAGADWARGIRK